MEHKLKIIVLSAFVALTIGTTGNSAAMENTARIATWYGNRDGAVSLRFDDNRDSHIKVVVPTLDRYGFKATFMVNPGKESYINYRDFWEREVVSRKHRLGNHTMHHRGAKTLEEAEYEIGEAARILRSVQKEESDLMVFAAGGLTYWGDAEWENSSDSYKRLADKFALIDLYDGFHKAKHVHSTHTSIDLCGLAGKAIENGTHQAYVFHDIGSPGAIDLVNLVKNGYHLTFGKESFTEFLDCLDERKERLWIAPLIDVYKYEAERKSATLTTIERRRDRERLMLDVGTDPKLYDQKLTVVMPASDRKIGRILQGGEPVREYESVNKMVLVHVKPRRGEIAIYYE